MGGGAEDAYAAGGVFDDGQHVVVGQVQGDSARQAGLTDDRLVRFTTQDDAVQAARRGEIDAAASTAIGNRALLARMHDSGLAAVDLATPVARTWRAWRAHLGKAVSRGYVPEAM